MTAERILLIEDDPLISRSLSLSLELQGYIVKVCETYQAGLGYARSEQCDLILLDINLPDGDGFNLCKEVRSRNKKLPILMLTANVAEESAVQGIQCGADDYIRKPFGLLELNARMQRLLVGQRTSQLNFGTLRIDCDKHLAWAGDQALLLGKREFAILASLIARAGEVLTRQEILDSAGHDAEVYDRTIDSHLSHLRKKLKSVGATEQIIPVYGIGYRLTTL